MRKRRISGCLCTLTVYEEARGELTVSTPTSRKKCQSRNGSGHGLAAHVATGNADPKIREMSALESHDAETMLPYIADRMEIVPSKGQPRTWGPSKALPRLASQDAGGAKRSAGFKLGYDSARGPGRTIFKQFATISNMKVVLSVMEAVVRPRGYYGLCSTTPCPRRRELRLGGHASRCVVGFHRWRLAAVEGIIHQKIIS